MKQTPYQFEGRTYPLSFTAEALFTIYDKFGQAHDILTSTACLEPTQEGFKNLCWMAALMAAQGELQLRAWGHAPQPMLTAEALRVSLDPHGALALRETVKAAIVQGFTREVENNQNDEINLVLLEREEAEKKAAEAAGQELNTYAQQLFASIIGPSMLSS